MSKVRGIASEEDVVAIESQVELALPSSTYEMLQRGAAIDPDALALSFFLRSADHRRPERWTYRELLSEITRTANFFTRLGVRKDSVIAYVLPNLPETHFVIWGGEAAGIVCSINPMLEAGAIADLLSAAGAEVLVTLAPFPGVNLWNKVKDILVRVPSLKHLVLVNMADRLHGVAGLVARLLQRREVSKQLGRGGVRGAVPAGVDVHDFRSGTRRETGASLNSERQFHPDDLSSYFCTGGTTGLPKIAKRSHGNEVANAWSAAQFLGDGVGSGKTFFCGLPLFHVNAVLATGLVPFSQGAHVLLGTPQGYRGDGVVERFWEIVERHRVSFFSGVPTVYSALLDVPKGSHDVTSLEYGLCGAAPMPVEVFRTFQERTGIKILEGYGLTEATCVSSANPPLGDRRLGSVGLRVPGQQMKAVEVDGAGKYVRDCGVDEVGTLVMSGPNIFAGYVLAEQDDGLWIDTGDGKRWLNSGDLGRRDADGYFWLTGRKKELIIRGGHNIDPATIEEPLHRHPAVKLAAAIGRPDVHAGELPVAYVQLRAGAAATEQQIADFLRGVITERAALPKYIRVIDEMPLTAVGKVFKPELKQRELLDALRAALAEADVRVRTITVDENRCSGTTLRVSLHTPGLESRARAVLGRFPFACIFDTATQS